MDYSGQPDIIQFKQYMLKVGIMENTSRYVVNALGKGGETYYTLCKDKQELQKWIHNNREKLVMDELIIKDKKQSLFSKWFGLRKLY
jgi:hypothetical protein